MPRLVRVLMLKQLREAEALSADSPMAVADLFSACNCPIPMAEEALQDLQTLGLVARKGDHVHLTALSRDVVTPAGPGRMPRQGWHESLFPHRRHRSSGPKARGRVLPWVTRQDPGLPRQPAD